MIEVIQNQVFTVKQQWEVTAGNYLHIIDCVFDGCLGRVFGEGNLNIVNMSAVNSMRGAFSVDIRGNLNANGLTFSAATIPDPEHKWSAFTLRSANGGAVCNASANGYAGNSFLIEVHPAEGQSVNEILFDTLKSTNAGGGMWLMNASNCIVNNFTGINSTYRPEVGCPEGHVYPCILDEQFDPATGVRTVGNTQFNNISCGTFGPAT